MSKYNCVGFKQDKYAKEIFYMYVNDNKGQTHDAGVLIRRRGLSRKVRKLIKNILDTE